jgi:hypothetical protein
MTGVWTSHTFTHKLKNLVPGKNFTWNSATLTCFGLFYEYGVLVVHRATNLMCFRFPFSFFLPIRRKKSTRMGTVLSVPNQITGGGRIMVDSGLGKSVPAVFGFNANSCKAQPSGKFNLLINLLIKDMGLHIMADIDSSAAQVCGFFCDDFVCENGQTKVLGTYADIGK